MINWLFLLSMGIVGFVAQAVDGTLGMGYGVFSTSLLVGIGLVPAIASASVHTAEIVTTLVSGISHWHLGNVRWKLFFWLVIPGVVGGVAGAYFLASIPGTQMKPVVSGVLLVMGGLVLYRFLAHKEPGQVSERRTPLWQASSLGLVAGFLDAVGGGGWGPVMLGRSGVRLSGCCPANTGRSLNEALVINTDVSKSLAINIFGRG